MRQIRRECSNSEFSDPASENHHYRHIISGTLVFILGILVNEAIVYVRKHSPKAVRWSATEFQKDYVIPGSLPAPNVQVDIGLTEDGYYVWRPHKDVSANNGSTANAGQ